MFYSSLVKLTFFTKNNEFKKDTIILELIKENEENYELILSSIISKMHMNEKNIESKYEHKINSLDKEMNINDNKTELEKENNELRNRINELENKIKLLNNQIIEINIKLKEKEDIIKMKDIELNKKINKSLIEFDDKSYAKRIIELQDEIKELKSILPFEIFKGEKLMSVIFISVDQKVHYSIICKNTDKFARLENVLYEEYPEYKESENYFLFNGKKISRFKTLDENQIKNNSIIIFQQIE